MPPGGKEQPETLKTTSFIPLALQEVTHASVPAEHPVAPSGRKMTVPGSSVLQELFSHASLSVGLLSTVTAIFLLLLGNGAVEKLVLVRTRSTKYISLSSGEVLVAAGCADPPSEPGAVSTAHVVPPDTARSNNNSRKTTHFFEDISPPPLFRLRFFVYIRIKFIRF
jgi:hypothetical protein